MVFSASAASQERSGDASANDSITHGGSFATTALRRVRARPNPSPARILLIPSFRLFLLILLALALPAAPAFTNANTGYMQLTWAGEGLHTLYVRAWDAAGHQTLATYGPIGYDITPPRPPAHGAPVELRAGAPAVLQWGAASDGGSGVAGYRVYIGPDARGISEWFTPTP